MIRHKNDYKDISHIYYNDTPMAYFLHRDQRLTHYIGVEDVCPEAEIDAYAQERLVKSVDSVSYKMTLFDNEKNREKLDFMDPMEVMWDDEDNPQPPETYWKLIDNLAKEGGGTIRITVERI